MKDKLLRVGEVASILDVSKAFVYQIIRTDKLRAVRIGTAVRVRPEDLEMFLQECMDDKITSWSNQEDSK